MTTKRKYDEKRFNRRSGGYDMSARDRVPLTKKQQLFIHHYLSPATLYDRTAAAKAAGFGKVYSSWNKAGRHCLEHPKISAEINRRLERTFAGTDLTVNRVLAGIEEARRMAIRLEQPGAATRASELQGKFLKMFVDQIQHLHTVEDAPTEELVELLKVMMGNIEGLSFHELMETIGGTVATEPRGDGTAESGASVGEGDSSTD